jgi:sugar (pentulose or hexulose) kinase
VTRRSAPVSCGVDVGSTNTKVVLLDADGAVVARSSRPTPRASEDLSIEADALVDAVEDMILEACGATFAVATVAVAGVGEDGVLVDARLHPLSRALAWFDPRRDRVHREVEAVLEPVRDLPVDTDSARTLVGWRWAAQQSDASAASSWLALADYAGARWTGRTFMSDTLAARTAAWTPVHRAWIGSRVDVTLGDRRLLPDVLHSGEQVGPWRSTRLREAGVLAADAVVVAGGHDHPIGGWGVDRMRPGAVLDSMGTAEVVVGQSPRALLPRGDGVDVAPGIRQPGTTLLCVQELARNMTWAAQDPAVGRALRAVVAGDLAPGAGVASGAFHPGGAGGASPRYAPGTPADAVFRASAVAGALAALGGSAVDRVAGRMGTATEAFATGGWSRSAGWIRLKEVVTGRRVRVIPEPEVTAVGAALLAAEAVGWLPSAARALGAAG